MKTKTTTLKRIALIVFLSFAAPASSVLTGGGLGTAMASETVPVPWTRADVMSILEKQGYIVFSLSGLGGSWTAYVSDGISRFEIDITIDANGIVTEDTGD